MKPIPILFAIAMISVSCTAFAQTDPKQSFDKLKTLAGTWEGVVRTVPLQPDIDGKPAQVTMRVTSMGNALMHEARSAARPDDPITMFYVNGDHVFLTHFCDAGNQPRMVGTASPDGKTIDFDFVDATGNMKYGHMQHGTFTFIDENHHAEDWTFIMAGDKVVRAHFDLQRTK